VQIIETALSNGTSPATIIGNAPQRASIEAGIDTVWAQAGIDVAFLPAITRYNNSFAYQGTSASRPSSDLNAILSASRSAGVLNTTPGVINIFFVNVVPGFQFTSENSANGIGNLGASGIAQFVGDNLLTFQSGRDVISRVVAHEIGHNLGLQHTADAIGNLMSPSGTTAQLTPAQIDAIFQLTRRNDSIAYIPTGGTGLLLPLPTQLAGDYNHSGKVDPADFIVWRISLGSTTNLAADGNANRMIDAADDNIWRSNFGRTAGAGSVVGTPDLVSSAIPEPGTLVGQLLVAAVFIGRRAKSQRLIHFFQTSTNFLAPLTQDS
jgi:hypothetical protein